MAETLEVVKATFKARSKKELEFILQTLLKNFGQRNVNSLSPIYIFRAKIWVLDVDIKIPNTLLRYDPDFKATKTDSGGTE